VRSTIDDDRTSVQTTPATSARKRPAPNIKITPTNAAAWEWFKTLDADASGYLDASELRNMVNHVGIKGLASRRLLKELGEMDREKKGLTSFREFALWWNRHKEIERRHVQPSAVKS
jgi:hypothetical protein